MNFNKDTAYALSGHQLNQLVKISKRLYTEQRMSGDEMRDMAQEIFEGILPKAVDLQEDF